MDSNSTNQFDVEFNDDDATTATHVDKVDGK